jgi:hypothetical protein
MIGLRIISVCAVALAIALTPAVAKDKAKKKADEPLPATLDFVGKWAKSAEACKEAESTDKAPIVFGPKSYDQFETHCKLWGVKNAGALWTANASCSVEGDKQRHSLMMSITGDAMDLGWDSPGGQKLVRCK